MIKLETWVEQIADWYKSRKHDHDKELEYLIFSAPGEVFGPQVTETQSKAIACWLDGCLRRFKGLEVDQPSLAYPFVQLAYSKLQQAVMNPESDRELKDWCMKRMQHITVLSLEFCNRQQDGEWEKESHFLIESHVSLMATLGWNEPRKHDQGNHPLH